MGIWDFAQFTKTLAPPPQFPSSYGRILHGGLLMFSMVRSMGTEAAAVPDLAPPDNGRTPDDDIPVGSYAQRKRDVDGGWAWLALLASFFIHSIIFGSMLGMGLFYSEFLDEFQKGPVATSWVIATNCALGALLGESLS